MGIGYAMCNWNKTLDCYPNVHGLGGNCTNFVSQCLLAEGAVHQAGNWYCKRKNSTYHDIGKDEEWKLNESWLVADPSPWISAREFRKTFMNAVNTRYVTYSNTEMKKNTLKAWEDGFRPGDVVQATEWILGIGTSGQHSMFIRGTIGSGEDMSFVVTYQSVNTAAKRLNKVAEDNSSWSFIFFDMTI